MVQRTRAGGISQMGRPTQGVKVMNMKDDDIVCAVALVVDSDGPDEVGPPPPELPTNEPTAEEVDTIPEDGTESRRRRTDRRARHELHRAIRSFRRNRRPPVFGPRALTSFTASSSGTRLGGYIGGTAPLVQTLKSGSRRSSG